MIHFKMTFDGLFDSIQNEATSQFTFPPDLAQPEGQQQHPQVQPQQPQRSQPQS